MRFPVLSVAMLASVMLGACAGPAPRLAAEQTTRPQGIQSPAPQGLDADAMSELMQRFHVPGVSIAIVRDFHVQWTGTYGVSDAETQSPVTSHTLFQAASISKPVTAFATLRAVEARKLSLDANVNDYLRTWKVPDNEYTHAGVTLRALLSHTSGTGDGFGFPGYDPTLPLPTVEQILKGEPPSNTGPVLWERAPFIAEKYSGGGIEIEQLVLQTVYRKPFAPLMQQLVLGPVGMRNSTYEQPLPLSKQPSAARAHGENGKPIIAKWHVYPEQAAAGLWTTPSDLAKLGIEVQKALRGESTLLSRATAMEMIAPTGTGNFAIGFQIEKRGQGWYFAHGGANWGFRCHLLMHRLKGYGVVVMTNSDSGSDLIAEIETRVAAAEGWDTKDQPLPR